MSFHSLVTRVWFSCAVCLVGCDSVANVADTNIFDGRPSDASVIDASRLDSELGVDAFALDSTAIDANSDVGTQDVAADISARDTNVDARARDVATDGSHIQALTRGASCPLSQRLGFIHIVQSMDGFRVDGRIDNALSSEYGPARASSGACSHFRPIRNCRPGPIGFSCACPNTCSGAQTCGYEGDCVNVVAPRTDVSLRVTTPRDNVTVASNATTGRIERTLQALTTGQLVQVVVDIPGQSRLTFDATMPTAFSDPFSGVQGNDSGQGPVTFSWTPANDGARMNLYMRANHHTPIGFSSCETLDSAATIFAADSVIEPLRPSTGLEGGTATRAFFGTAQLEGGCFEVAIGTSAWISP